VIHLTDENFENEVQRAEKPVLVDFFAIWCPPCSILSSVLEKLEKEFEGKVIFAKADVDAAPRTSQKYGINPIPVVILFREGEAVGGFVGLKGESEIKEWLEKLLEKN
jgi:thioredoxin 1